MRYPINFSFKHYIKHLIGYVIIDNKLSVGAFKNKIKIASALYIYIFSWQNEDHFI